jgi:hypothetical protein
MSVAATSQMVSGGYGDATSSQVDQLQVRHHLRGGSLDEAHVAALAELEGRWPPLLVWGEHPEVVLDGAHRLAAARRLGHSTVLVTRFYGTPDEAYVEAVRRNIAHGLPLSVADRMRAGQRILDRHPEWSDRRVGEVCALSAHSVARIRERVKKDRPAEARVLAFDTRLGRDGRTRPAQPGLIRERVVDAIRSNPTGSLRDIASIARVSPETVRRIRKDVSSAELAERPEQDVSQPADWRDEPALATRPELQAFVEWLERTDPGEGLGDFVSSVPLSRVYQIADEARRRAARWTAFATALEARARGKAYLPV